MKKTKYIIRFDDLCPQMNVDAWNKIEEIMDSFCIKPIVAVIPHNEDVSIQYEGLSENDFWERVRNMQKKGWTIALHGYNHVYTSKKTGMLGISCNSEFCDISFEHQCNKIEKGLDIFHNKGIDTDTFIAPSHSFNKDTLNALKKYGVKNISDGFFNRVVRYRGINWVPCKDWDFISKARPGVHTLCIHFMKMDLKRLSDFEEQINSLKDFIIPFNLALNDVQTIALKDIIINSLTTAKFRIKRLVKKVLRKK